MLSQPTRFDLTQAHDAVRRMVETLGWDEYHTVKNIALATLLEASELVQKLQWKTEEEVKQLFPDSDAYREVSYEIADVTINVLSLCDRLDLDLNHVTVEKCKTIVKRFHNREGISRGANRTVLRCQACSQTVKADWHYCAKCGSRLIRKDG
jgi:NTP pyrophosphatase (non-canonical NTP hydrolase)